MLNDIMEKFKQQYGNYNKASLTLYTDCSGVLRSFFKTSNGIEEKDIFSFNSLEQLNFFLDCEYVDFEKVKGELKHEIRSSTFNQS